MANAIDDALQANEEYARDFAHGELGARPARKLAVVTCMDCRLEPLRFLGLEPGEAHVIANAGGRAADALRSLVVSSAGRPSSPGTAFSMRRRALRPSISSTPTWLSKVRSPLKRQRIPGSGTPAAVASACAINSAGFEALNL